MKIAYTRAMVNAALNGDLENARFEPDPIFGVQVPAACCDVPDEILWPRNTWDDTAAYDQQARELARMFIENFRPFEGDVPEDVRATGPKAD